jgi:peptide/nickel transport system substrate-binding protein
MRPRLTRALVGTVMAIGFFTFVAVPVEAQSGRLVIGVVAGPETLDPHMSASLATWNVARNVFESLLARELKTFGYKPGLAESHRVVNDTTWEFKLRRGVKFHNGEDFNAEAVKFSIERVLNPEQKSPSRGQNVLIDRVEVVDPHTVRIITKKPMPMLRERFTAPGYTGTIPMVPPRYVKEKGDQHFAANPVGTGPFRLVRWVKAESVELEANPGYWGGPPKIKTVVIKTIPEPATRVSALLTGEADIISHVPPDSVEMIKKDPRTRISETDVDGIPPHVQINTMKGGPLADVRVRQALGLAIDMDLVVKRLLRGHGVQRALPLDPRAFGYHPDLPLHKPNLDRAKKLLAEAGHPNGQGIPELVFIFPTGGRYLMGEAVAEYVGQQFSKLGVRVKLSPGEYGAWLAQMRDKKSYDLGMIGWGGGGRFEVGDTMFFQFYSGSPFSWLSSADFDQALDRARETMDQEARKQLYWKAQEIAYKLAALLPAHQTNSIYGVRSDVVWEAPLGEMILLYEAARNP